jgi:hypothetical protein
MATQNKLTHNGTKKATHTTIKGASFYFSRPVNSKKKGTTFLNVSGFNPVTGNWEKVQLSARQLNALKAVIA